MDAVGSYSRDALDVKGVVEKELVMDRQRKRV